MDMFAMKSICLGWLKKQVVDAFFKFPKPFADVARIIKIAKSIEADGSEKKLGDASRQRVWIEICPKAKKKTQEIWAIIPT